MSERYGFFNAVINNGVADRSYGADDVNEIFRGIISDGVIKGLDDALIVSAGTSGLSVNVDTGKAFVKNHWYINDSVKTLTLSAAHATLNRYTTIVVRYSKSSRKIELGTVDGTAASLPLIPTLTQTDDIYELSLANIYVGAGVTSISSTNVIDSRTYVSGLVDPAPLNYRRYDVTVTSENGQRYFDIPSDYNFTLNTKLQVYSGGLLEASDAYTIQINEVEGNYMIVFPTIKPTNTIVSFVMIN